MTNQDWLEAQYSVLGAALIEPELVPKVMSETAERDYSDVCRIVYKAMRKLFLAGVSVDVVTLRNALGPEYNGFLVQLMEITPTTANLNHYITLCREQARVLAVRAIAQELSGAENSEQARSLLEQATNLMVDKPSLRIVTMSDALRSFMDRHSTQTSYLTWPVRELNERIYSELGDFVIFAGYPSTGKSAWALQCAWHWAAKYKVGFFSLETSSEKLFDRQMAALSQLSMDDIKRNNITDKGWEDICCRTGEITERNLELIPAAGMSPADVRAVTMMRGYQIIIVDYLQLLQGSGINRTEQVTGISLALHTMAQSMGVTVVALSQLKRKSDTDSPDMSDLRESGQIEQDADVVMILKLEDKNRPDGNREMYVAKNKEGTCPKIVLAFDGKHQTFTKAQRTGETISKYVADGKKIQGQRRREANMDQMSLLPPNTPVPF